MHFYQPHNFKSKISKSDLHPQPPPTFMHRDASGLLLHYVLSVLLWQKANGKTDTLCSGRQMNTSGIIVIHSIKNEGVPAHIARCIPEYICRMGCNSHDTVCFHYQI